MVNRELYNILDELKGIFGSTGFTPELVYGWLQAKNYLNGNEIYLIKAAGIPLSQINVLCDLLKAKPNEIFAEIYKVAETHQWIEVTDFLKRKLKEHNFAYLLNLSNESSDAAGGTKDTAGSSGKGSGMKTNQQFSSAEYINKKLLDVFNANNMVETKDYLIDLLRRGALTDNDIEDIKSERYSAEKQVTLSRKLAVHGIEAVEVLYELSKDKKHRQFSRDLKAAFDFED